MTTFQRIVFFGSMFLVVRCVRTCIEESKNSKPAESNPPATRYLLKWDERDTTPKRKLPKVYDTPSSKMDNAYDDDELLERQYNRDAVDKFPKETLDPDYEFYKEYYTP